jgi:hypothetical protein
MSFTYWAYDDTCLDPKTDGYVGVTENPSGRRSVLVSIGRVPKDAKFLILFEGDREQCLRLERVLRPEKNIGWNRDRGGKASPPHQRGGGRLGWFVYSSSHLGMLDHHISRGVSTSRTVSSSHVCLIRGHSFSDVPCKKFPLLII